MTKINYLLIFIIIELFISFSINAQDLLSEPTSEVSTEPEIVSEPAPELTDKPQVLESPVKKANGPIISEEELLKAPPKPVETKVKSAKISESEIYIQEAEKLKATEIYKNLRLNDVIEQGLRKNYDQTIRDQKKEINDIEFSGVKKSFWMPELKLTLTTADQRIGTLASGAPPTNPNPSVPTGAFGLQLGNYTVFNWGKDYNLYLNSKTNFTRNQQILEESRREFRLDLIAAYFTLMSYKNIEKIAQEQLKQASFIYRLNKEKIVIGKTSQQDYYQARSEYLRSQSEYRSAKIAADQQDETMAYLLADEVGTKYILDENLIFKKLKITLTECVELSEKNNPSILNTKSSLENAERSHDNALKENLPLPKFSINLGAYSKKFGPNYNRTTYENYSNGGDMELVASINASWSLTGADGLFNSDKIAKSWMNKELLQKELEKYNHFAKSSLRQTYNNILSYQNQMLIQEARIPSLQKTFDTVLDNYLNNRTKFNDFHLVLTELTQAKILFEETKISHLKEKLALAKFAGIEDFPGENFDKIVELRKENK